MASYISSNSHKAKRERKREIFKPHAKIARCLYRNIVSNKIHAAMIPSSLQLAISRFSLMKSV
jgi:2'-5' RNA ligase